MTDRASLQARIDQRKAATEAALIDPQPGDRFSEMYSFWIYVVARHGMWVMTMEGHDFPNASGQWQTVAQLRKRLSYEKQSGTWVDLCDRGNNVDGWVDYADGEALDAGVSTD